MNPLPARFGRLSDDRLDELIGGLYDAALAPASLDRVIGDLAATVGASHALLFTPYQPVEAGGLYVGHNLPAACLVDYSRYYYQHDLWLRAGEVRGWPGAEAQIGESLVPEAVLTRSEWFNDFLRTLDIGRSLSVRADPGAGAEDAGRINLSFYRPPGWPGFEAAEAAFIDRIVPHVVKAILLARRLRGEALDARVRAALVDTVADGLIVLDADSRIRLINDNARRIVDTADGLAMVRGRLTASRSEDAATLSRLIAESAAPSAIRTGGAMPILRPSGRSPLRLLIGPLLTAPAGLDRLGAGLAVVFVTDPEEAARVPADWLQALFDLTPAEAKVASELAAGHSIAAIAARHRVSRNTVRVQVQLILAKTETRRQAELVAMLAKLPRSFEPPGGIV